MKDDFALIIGICAITLALIGMVLPESTPITSFSYNDLTDTPIIYQLNLYRFVPMVVSMASTMSPNTHGTDRIYLFPFDLESNITVNTVIIKTSASVANSLYLGIFNSTGHNVWKSDLLSPNGGWLIITYNLPIILTPQTYYFGTTNNGNTSSTACYTIANFGASVFPRWGSQTIDPPNGIMPDNINVTGITERSTGFMVYVLLSYWTI